MSKIAIIHTTPVTVDSLKELVNEIIPGTDVINIVDDSILPQLLDNNGDLNIVEERITKYIRITEELNADLIMSACSSVGEIFDKVNSKISVPVTRIDDAMAELAVNSGNKIGVAATLETTLKPTLDLLKKKALEAGKEIEFKTELVSSAYEKLMAGDKDGHDQILAERLQELVNGVEIVVLAQASMARVVNSLASEERDKFLTSPRLGISRVKSLLEGEQ